MDRIPAFAANSAPNAKKTTSSVMPRPMLINFKIILPIRMTVALNVIVTLNHL